MRKSDYPRASYVDISYGWQARGDISQHRSRRHRRWGLLLAGLVALGALAGLSRCWI